MMLLIISGPSGVGKNHLLGRARREFEFDISVPYTTRSPRPDEVDGRDYTFVERSDFLLMIQRGGLFEWDYALSNYYGIPADLAERVGRGGRPLAMHALARMALRIKAQMDDVVLVFLMPGGSALTRPRLANRQSGDRDLLLREELAAEERSHSVLFDYVVPEADALSMEASGLLLSTVLGSLG